MASADGEQPIDRGTEQPVRIDCEAHVYTPVFGKATFHLANSSAPTDHAAVAWLPERAVEQEKSRGR
jgi:hypothetical protein